MYMYVKKPEDYNFIWLCYGQAVNCWLLTMKTWVQSQASPCGMFNGQSGTVTGFSPSVYCL
jgi:hypothetical protein